MYWVAANLMIYGGGKNYLGSDKVMKYQTGSMMMISVLMCLGLGR